MQKVYWDVEELVALFDIYRRSKGKTNDAIDEELMNLSLILHKRAERLEIVHDEKFRNFNGMRMMLQNATYIATGEQQGLSAVSASMRIVYKMLMVAPEAFELILSEFETRYGKLKLEL